MPRVVPLYSDFFFLPLTEDVEQLLARFQLSDSVRYETFSAVWRSMSFSDAFAGIGNTSEMRRFCRVALATAVTYSLPPYSYQIRVGGLYLMFAFYHAQLATPPVKIRLALKDWASVQKLVRDSVDAGHHDVVYVYEKLVAAKAVHFTAMPHFLTFQKQRRPKTQPVSSGFLGRTTLVQELVSADLLEELTNVQDHYDKLKAADEEVRVRVTVTQSGFASRLRDSVSEFIAWQEKTFPQKPGDVEEGPPEEGSGSRRAKLLTSIKNKSYSSFQEAPKSRRHRRAETVDSSSSGPDPVQEPARRKRPPSLRARTWKRLGLTQEGNRSRPWLLSVPEQREKGNHVDS